MPEIELWGLPAGVADINVFTNLHQQGRDFGEIAVMTFFAGLTVLLALFAPPVARRPQRSALVSDG
ncbi:MAG: hypothetical protein OXD37_00675 [Acidimicrobiaceae bacterium]|nr:hypothetical protein [Acidimicrobiaceae bacterium]